MRYGIKTQDNDILSTHSTFELAEKKLDRLKAYRCPQCGNNKGGWGKCGCGQGVICSAEHYHTTITEIPNEEEQALIDAYIAGD